jgi:altronate hydrolase
VGRTATRHQRQPRPAQRWIAGAPWRYGHPVGDAEIHGAEHLLIARAASPEVAERLLARLRWWEDYAARNGAQLNNNPSPGNKAGGITTILEKSLGAVAKGGGSTLMDVVEYAEPVRASGLVFMDTPGYDPVSATGQVAGGANLICFTTGRGSAYGCAPSPSLKLATNTAMYQRMSLTWISTPARSSMAR